MACVHRMAHRKWKETKLQPGTAGPGSMLGCCLISLHFLWAILCPQAVYPKLTKVTQRRKAKSEVGGCRVNVSSLRDQNREGEKFPKRISGVTRFPIPAL